MRIKCNGCDKMLIDFKNNAFIKPYDVFLS